MPLSPAAKGLWAYMLDKPDDWQFSADRIASDPAITVGSKAVESTLRELRVAGLVRYVKRRGLHGTWASTVDVRESLDLAWPDTFTDPLYQGVGPPTPCSRSSVDGTSVDGTSVDGGSVKGGSKEVLVRKTFTKDLNQPPPTPSDTSTSPTAAGKEEDGSKLIRDANRHRTTPWKNTTHEQAVVEAASARFPRWQLKLILALNDWKTETLTTSALTTRLRIEGDNLQCPACRNRGERGGCDYCGTDSNFVAGQIRNRVRDDRADDDEVGT